MGKNVLKVGAAVLALALTVPAYAAVQNVKVSGDLKVQAVDRFNFALGSTDSPNIVKGAGGINSNQDLFLSIARVRLDAELTDNVSLVVRLLNERVWDQESGALRTGTGNTTDSDLNIDLAYATLKEMFYSPLTLTIGRQELHFGNDLIVGDVDTNGTASTASSLVGTQGAVGDLGDLSARKSFDALRATLDYSVADQPLTLDLVYAKVDENTNNRADDINLYGVNANYALNEDHTVEAYFWLRDRKPGTAGTNTGVNDGSGVQSARGDRLSTIGLRSVCNDIIDNLTLQAEGAYQVGTRVYSAVHNPNQSPNRALNSLLNVDAWALQIIADYVFDGVANSPTLGFSYTHLSGDKTDTSGNYRGWDPMFENQASGTIFNKILGYSNANFFNLNGSIKPEIVDDLTIKANYYNIGLDRALTSTEGTWYTLTGINGGQQYQVTSKKGLGNEIDLDFIYDYTEDVQFGLNLGWFIPGEAFANENRDTASQAIATMTVAF
ncbi:MAG: alginate export family protein [Candidatus Omnitrophota bacterium]